MRQELSTREFVLGMLPEDGVVRADRLYDVGAMIGFTVHQVRLCLSRLVAEGAFVQQGRGRVAVFTETETHRAATDPDIEYLRYAYRQDSGEVRWDGRWHLAGFTIEEERRELRNALRERILALGGALLPGGMYVQAAAWEDELRSWADGLGIADRLTLATASSLDVGGVREDRAVAAVLWPLSAMADGYRAFNARFADPFVPEADTDGALAHCIGLTTAFEICIRPDPLLPPELLGLDWPGVEARRILRRVAEQLGRLRQDGGFPALFARYDGVFG